MTVQEEGVLRRGRLAAALCLTTALVPGFAAGQTASPAAPVLNPVTVTGAAARAAIESTDSYTVDRATVGGKEPVEIREIPRTVSVVTRERMNDQNMTQLEDAMRRTAGTLVLTNDPGRSSIFSRGFEFDNARIDGLPAPLSSIHGTQPDLAIFDRIEVMKGPAGLFDGSGEPAGTLNLVTKRALPGFYASGAASAGSWANYRAEGDVGGSLFGSDRVRGRVVGAYQDRDSFVNVNQNRVGVGYGTIEADLTDATTLSFTLWRQDREATPFNGLPVYTNGKLIDFSRSTFIGANWNRFRNHSTEGIAALEHRFANGGHAKVSARYADRGGDFKYAYGSSAINPAAAVATTPMTAIARQFWETALSADAYVTSPFQLFGQTHNVTVGTDYRRYEQKIFNGQVASFGTPVNVFNPNSNLIEPNIPYTTRTDADPTQYGLYGQVRLKPIQPLTLVLGGRFSWYDVTNQNLVNNSRTTFSDDGRFTPNVGLVFDITENISAYASYADVFQPQTATDARGNVIQPRSGWQYEAGVKGSFFGGQLNTSAAVFRIRDKNRAVADPTNPSSSVANGEVQVQGFEAEISGRILPGWDIYAGYAYTQTEYIKAPVTQQGTTFSTFTPKNNFNLWTKYSPPQGPLKQAWIGGGLRVLSSFYTNLGNTRITQGTYAVVDAQLGYNITENVQASLTVGNLFDEKYYSRVGGGGFFNFYGEPRNYMVKLSAAF